MHVRMRFAGRISRRMPMLMVFVVPVEMLMRNWLVSMLMGMLFR